MRDEPFFGGDDLIQIVEGRLKEWTPRRPLIGFYGIDGNGKSALFRQMLDATWYSFLIDFSSAKLNTVNNQLRAFAAQTRSTG